MMNSESIITRMNTATAPGADSTFTNELPKIQPTMPPPIASAPPGWGCPPKMWQRPLTETSSRLSPTPMRPLSSTDDGCRNSQIANSSMITGSAKASRPNSPPKVQASRVIATGSLGLNHSTNAPAMARRKMKNGTPSRRSSLARVSRPKSLAAAPTVCAKPSQATVSSPDSATGGAFLAGDRRVGALEPRRAVVLRARGVEVLRVAMGPKLPVSCVTGLLERRVLCAGAPSTRSRSGSFRNGSHRSPSPGQPPPPGAARQPPPQQWQHPARSAQPRVGTAAYQ